MLKKSILLENKASLTTKNLQLVIKTEIRESSIPIEDIGYIVIDHPEIYLSIPALNLLLDNNTAIIICNTNHLPNGMFLNLNSHHIQQEIFKNQINASAPLKKQLWQQTVVEKITNQGILLEKITTKKNNFEFLASKVLSGDISNMEGVAASFY
jgi:CRISPR-associated protein Cas1